MAEKLNEEFIKALKERVDLRMELLPPEDKKHAPKILEELTAYYEKMANDAPEGSVPASLKAGSGLSAEKIRNITENNLDFKDSLSMRLDIVANQVRGIPNNEVMGIVKSVKPGDVPEFDYNNVTPDQRDYIDTMIGAEVQQSKSTDPNDKTLPDDQKYKIGFLLGAPASETDPAEHKAAKDKLKQMIGGVDAEFAKEVNNRRDSMAEQMREEMYARSQERQEQGQAPQDVGAPQQGIDSPKR